MSTLNTFFLVLSSISIALSHQSLPSSWTALANITLLPRQEHTTIFLPPSTIGILGGVLPSESLPPPTTALMQFYSIPHNIWRTVSSIPKPVNHPNPAVVNGKIYVLSGLALTNTTSGLPVWNHISDSWVYSPHTDSWSTLAPIPEDEARGSAGMGVYDGKIFLAGGTRSLELVPGGLQNNVDTVSVFDTVMRKWIQVPEAAKKIPQERDHAGTAVVGSNMYVLGGRDHERENVKDTVFILNLENLEGGWRTSDSRMPTPRGGVATGVIGTKIYTFGGETNTHAATGVFNQTEVYDTVRDQLEELAPMRIPRHGTYAVGVWDRLYIPGGGIAQSAGPVADFDVFRP